jgi:hypothetical protein
MTGVSAGVRGRGSFPYCRIWRRATAGRALLLISNRANSVDPHVPGANRGSEVAWVPDGLLSLKVERECVDHANAAAAPQLAEEWNDNSSVTFKLRKDAIFTTVRRSPRRTSACRSTAYARSRRQSQFSSAPDRSRPSRPSSSTITFRIDYDRYDRQLLPTSRFHCNVLTE